MCSRWGAGELLKILTFKVWVLFASNPANFNTEGLAWKIPLLPTHSKRLFVAIGFSLPGITAFSILRLTSITFLWEILLVSILNSDTFRLSLDSRGRSADYDRYSSSISMGSTSVIYIFF